MKFTPHNESRVLAKRTHRPSATLKIALFCIVIAAVVIISCSPGRVTIITDMPEVLDYLEFLRSNTEIPNIDIVFSENPDRAIAVGGVHADLIISSSIGHEDFQDYLHAIPMRRFQGWNKALNDGFLLEDLYEASLQPFIQNRAIRVIPLAYDIPIMYVSDSIDAQLETRTSLTYSEFLNIADEYNRFSGDNYSSMGFSSLRDLHFIVLLLRNFSGSRGTMPAQADFDNTLSQINTFLAAHDQKPEGQLYFNTVFAYSPDHAVMDAGRLQSAFGTLSTFNDERESYSEQPFIWIGGEEGIEILTPGIYVGVTKMSRQKFRSISFIRRLLSSSNQRAYLLQDDSRTFSAFLGRFSTNRITNSVVADNINNNIRFPSEENLLFPGVPDPLWDNLRDEVLIPWLSKYYSGDEANSDQLYQNFMHFKNLYGGYH